MGLPGKIYLLGAGPGDLELLTLKAVRVLRQADTILLDALVNPEILDFVSKEAEVIEVGKRGGISSTPQKTIHELMLEKVLAGRTVVRIKGGDPLIFGRAGEELEFLAKSGIAVELVPGITSGIASAHALGCSLTHRDVCHGVAFVTGHCGQGAEVDWSALVASGLTLVVYMGITNVAATVEKLLEAGLKPETACAVVHKASMPDERLLLSQLKNLDKDVVASGIGSPAIVIIGDVTAWAKNGKQASADGKLALEVQ